MGRKAEDLTGRVFGFQTVIRRSEKKSKDAYWIVRCICGNERAVNRQSLVKHSIFSCGCKKSEIHSAKMTVHGHSSTCRHVASKEYKAWDAAKYRCHNPNSNSFPKYGGRGIAMCDKWRESFQAFLEDMGPAPPGTSLDRIDNYLGYYPGNCRWLDRIGQMNNLRKNVLISYGGNTMTLRTASTRFSIPIKVLRNKCRYGKKKKVITVGDKTFSVL